MANSSSIKADGKAQKARKAGKAGKGQKARNTGIPEYSIGRQSRQSFSHYMDTAPTTVCF